MTHLSSSVVPVAICQRAMPSLRNHLRMDPTRAAQSPCLQLSAEGGGEQIARTHTGGCDEDAGCNGGKKS